MNAIFAHLGKPVLAAAFVLGSSAAFGMSLKAPAAFSSPAAPSFQRSSPSLQIVRKDQGHVIATANPTATVLKAQTTAVNKLVAVTTRDVTAVRKATANGGVGRMQTLVRTLNAKYSGPLVASGNAKVAPPKGSSSAASQVSSIPPTAGGSVTLTGSGGVAGGTDNVGIQ